MSETANPEGGTGAGAVLTDEQTRRQVSVSPQGVKILLTDEAE